MAVFGAGRGAFDKLSANAWFVQDIGSAIMNKYQRANPGFECLVFLWCASYWVPFHQFSQDELYLLFYEDLLSNPDTELENLFAFLGHTYSQLKVQGVFSKPSTTTRLDRGTSFQGFRFDDWMAHITPGQLEQAYEIMSLFGLEKLYSPVTAKPNREIAIDLFGCI
jgi:hypothetical protein